MSDRGTRSHKIAWLRPTEPRANHGLSCRTQGHAQVDQDGVLHGAHGQGHHHEISAVRGEVVPLASQGRLRD